jgi:hypothetical protein
MWAKTLQFLSGAWDTARIVWGQVPDAVKLVGAGLVAGWVLRGCSGR